MKGAFFKLLVLAAFLMPQAPQPLSEIFKRTQKASSLPQNLFFGLLQSSFNKKDLVDPPTKKLKISEAVTNNVPRTIGNKRLSVFATAAKGKGESSFFSSSNRIRSPPSF